MRLLLTATVVLVLVSPAGAQLATPNAAGLRYGHVHLNVSDIEVHKTLWVEHFGGVVVQKGPLTAVRQTPTARRVAIGHRGENEEHDPHFVNRSTEMAANETMTKLVRDLDRHEHCHEPRQIDGAQYLQQFMPERIEVNDQLRRGHEHRRRPKNHRPPSHHRSNQRQQPLDDR